MAFYKLKNSEYPSWCQSEDEKTTFLNELNRKMAFRPPNILTIKNVAHNKFQRETHKNNLNNFVGKWAQGLTTDNVKTIFVNSYEALEKVLSSKKVVNMCEISDKICEVLVKVPKSRICSNPNGNLIYTSLVNAFARDRLYMDMLALKRSGADLIYCDTDAVIIKTPKDFICPLKQGYNFGDWKKEYEGSEIKAFYALGEKNYGIVYEESQILKDSIKISGLCMSKMNQKLDINKYKELVVSSLLEKKSSMELQHYKNSTTKYTTVNKEFNYTLKATRLRKRFYICQNANIISYPFGFKKD